MSFIMQPIMNWLKPTLWSKIALFKLIQHHLKIGIFNIMELIHHKLKSNKKKIIRILKRMKKKEVSIYRLRLIKDKRIELLIQKLKNSSLLEKSFKNYFYIYN